MKVLSDVTYQIQLVNCQQGRYDRHRRHRVVVHFNRLKPYYKPNFIQTQEPGTSQPNFIQTQEPGTSQPPADTEPLTNEDPSFIDDEWTPLIDQPPIPNDHHGDRDQDQQPRGGSVWGGRLRRTVHPPARFQPGTVSAGPTYFDLKLQFFPRVTHGKRLSHLSHM